MIKMRGSIYHADISNGFNVRVYSTEPPEDLVVRLGHFFYSCRTFSIFSNDRVHTIYGE